MHAFWTAVSAQPLQECVIVLSVACQKPLWTVVRCGDGVPGAQRWMVPLVHTGSWETALAWQHASALAAQALEHAQQHATVQLDGHKHPTVHGDVRLPNIIGHVVNGNEVDRVVFVDFDWAGLQGITRYRCAEIFTCLTDQLESRSGLVACRRNCGGNLPLSKRAAHSATKEAYSQDN